MDLSDTPCPAPHCSNVFRGSKELLKHMRQSHFFETLFSCKFELCDAVSRSYHGYRMHLARRHKQRLGSQALVREQESPPSPVLMDVELYNDQEQSAFENAFVKLALKCREKYTLPLTVFNSIMQDVVKLLGHHESFIVDQQAVTSSCPDGYLQQLWQKVQNKTSFRRLCIQLSLVEPIEIVLSEEEHDSYQYIPILETLANYISHEDVLGSMEAFRHRRLPDALYNYTDGSMFKDGSFFSGDTSLLRLHFFCDEVEVCNPIGSGRGFHKLTCVYFILGNIEMRYQSRLKNILPALIAKSAVVKKYGYRKLLEPLLKDLMTLVEHDRYHFFQADTDTDSLSFLAADSRYCIG